MHSESVHRIMNSFKKEIIIIIIIIIMMMMMSVEAAAAPESFFISHALNLRMARRSSSASHRKVEHFILHEATYDSNIICSE